MLRSRECADCLDDLDGARTRCRSRAAERRTRYWRKNLVADGETVAEGDPLYELEAENVEMAIDALWSGVVSWKVEVGETYPVGTLIATITA